MVPAKVRMCITSSEIREVGRGEKGTPPPFIRVGAGCTHGACDVNWKPACDVVPEDGAPLRDQYRVGRPNVGGAEIEKLPQEGETQEVRRGSNVCTACVCARASARHACIIATMHIWYAACAVALTMSIMKTTSAATSITRSSGPPASSPT